MKLFLRLPVLGLVLLAGCAAVTSVAQSPADERRHGWGAYPYLSASEARYAIPDRTGGYHPADRRRHGWGAYPYQSLNKAHYYAATRARPPHPADQRRHTWGAYPDCPC